MKKGSRIWICDGCGKRETWRKGWHWLYGIKSLRNLHEDPSLVLPLAVCSSACEDKALAEASAALEPPRHDQNPGASMTKASEKRYDLSTEISDLSFAPNSAKSVRIRNALSYTDIRTLGDLVAKDDAPFYLRLKNMGTISFSLLRDFVRNETDAKSWGEMGGSMKPAAFGSRFARCKHCGGVLYPKRLDTR